MVDQKRGNIAVLSPLQGCDLGSNQPGEAPCQKTHRSRPITAETTALLDPPRLPVMPLQKIGIGGHLAMPPLPHHRAYGSVPRRFGWMSVHRVSNRGSPSELK